MKKTLLLMLVLVLVAAFALCGCGDNKASENGSSNAAEVNTTEAADTAAGLVGQWEYAVFGSVYTFNEDGTGSYLFGETEMKFTYEDKGDSFSLLYDGDTAASEYEYSIEGNVLTMIDSFGSPVEYTRK